MSKERESIRCPHCFSTYCPVEHVQHKKVSYSLLRSDGTSQKLEQIVTRRFRRCNHCKVRFVTVESLEEENNPGFPQLFEPGPEILHPQRKKGDNPYL